jgi:general secretion pathway protein H
VTGRNKGFSLIEVVIVVALIALALTLAGPRIGAGFGRLELERSAQSIRNFIKLARIQAQRTDREHYVILDRKRDVIALLNPEMRLLRQEELPSSVEIILESDRDAASIFIAPSGIVRGEPIRLQGRAGQTEIRFE